MSARGKTHGDSPSLEADCAGWLNKLRRHSVSCCRHQGKPSCRRGARAVYSALRNLRRQQTTAGAGGAGGSAGSPGDNVLRWPAPSVAAHRRHHLLRLLPHPACKPHNAQDPRHHAHPRPSRRHDRRPGRL